MEGIVPVLKPKGPTSHDIVGQIRRLVGPVKVGHAGTLDPLASGVLVVGVGREATKRLNDEMLKEKEYEAVIKLGATSTTDDEEGDKSEVTVTAIPTETEIREILKEFIGTISQVPPQFSAIKIKGKPAYQTARQGGEVPLVARPVHIFDIEFLSYTWPYLSLRVRTGPGVYIRSLARDIGDRLGCGGYIEELVRTRVGEFHIAQAVSPADVPSYLSDQSEAL
jgi:tRNA pseudouridine55 synthase